MAGASGIQFRTRFADDVCALFGLYYWQWWSGFLYLSAFHGRVDFIGFILLDSIIFLFLPFSPTVLFSYAGVLPVTLELMHQIEIPISF